MTDWQPIETAPHDRRILLWTGLSISIGRYYDDRYSHRPRPYWDRKGISITLCRNNPPLLWQSLPEPLEMLP